MSSNLGSAFIEVVADASGLRSSLERDVASAVSAVERDLNRGLGGALGDLGDLAEAAAEGLADGFADGVADAVRDVNRLDDALDGVGGSVTVDVDTGGALAEVRSLDDALDGLDADVDLRDAERAFDDLADEAVDDLERIEREARETGDGIGGTFRRLAGVAAAAFAGVQVGQFLGGAVEQAADLGESINAIQVVLGDASDQFLDFSSGAADSLGLTQAAVNQALIPAASLLKNAGSEGDALAGQLESLATRAADVGSVFNEDVNVVLDALGAALRGEAEPARRFGVNLNAAAIEAQALADGLVAEGEALTDAAKVQAAYNLVLAQTSTFAGDFENTANSLPNVVKRLSATFQEAQGALGGELLAPLADAAAALLPVITSLVPVLSTVGQALVGAIGPVADAVGTLVEPLSAFAVGLAEAFAPVVQVFASLAPAIAPILTLAGELLSAFAVPLSALATLVADVFATVGDVFGEFTGDILGALAPGLEALTSTFQTLADSGALADLAASFALVLGFVGEFVASGLSAILGAVAEAATAVVPALATVASVLADVVGLVGQQLAGFVVVLAEAFVALASAVAPVVAVLVEGLAEVLTTLLPVIVDVATVLVDVFADVLVTIAPVVAEVAEALADGLLDVIIELLPVVVELAELLVVVIDALEPLLDLVVLLLDEGLGLLIPVVAALARLLAGTLTVAVRAVTSVLAPVVRVVGQVLAAFVGLADGVRGLPRAFRSAFDSAGRIVRAAVAALGEAVGNVGEFFLSLPSTIASALGQAVSFVAANIGDIIGFIALLPIRIPIELANLAVVLVQALANAFTSAVQFVRDNIDEMVAFVAALPGRAVQGLATLGTSLLTAIGNAFTGAVTLARSLLDGLVDFVVNLPSRIAQVAGSMLEAGRTVVSALLDGIGRAVSAAGSFVADVGRGIGNAVIRGINSVLGGIERSLNQVIVRFNAIPVLPDTNFRVNIPNVPALAAGGFAVGPSLALIGEGGHDEAVLPFGGRGYSRTVSALADAIRQAGITGPSTSGPPMQVTQNITTPYPDPRVVASAVLDRLVAAGGA